MKLQCYCSLHDPENQQFFIKIHWFSANHVSLAQCMHPAISTVLRRTENQHRMRHTWYKCSVPCCFVPQDSCALSSMARYNRQHRLDVSPPYSTTVTDTRALDLQRAGARLEPPAFRGQAIKTGGRAKAHASFFAPSGKSTGSHPATPALVTE